MKTRILTGCALFAALTAVCSQIAIPLPSLIPINLATLSVFLCGALLGAKWGLVSQLVYLLLGFVGLPVFAGFRAGPAALLGPTGGYLIGYLLAALLVGLLLCGQPAKWMLPVSMLAGMCGCYALGTAWYMLSTGSALLPALMACVFPFLVGDAAKIAAASIVTARLGVRRFVRADAQTA